MQCVLSDPSELPKLATSDAIAYLTLPDGGKLPGSLFILNLPSWQLGGGGNSGFGVAITKTGLECVIQGVSCKKCPITAKIHSRHAMHDMCTPNMLSTCHLHISYLFLLPQVGDLIALPHHVSTMRCPKRLVLTNCGLKHQ